MKYFMKHPQRQLDPNLYISIDPSEWDSSVSIGPIAFVAVGCVVSVYSVHKACWHSIGPYGNITVWC